MHCGTWADSTRSAGLVIRFFLERRIFALLCLLSTTRGYPDGGGLVVSFANGGSPVHLRVPAVEEADD